MTRGEGDLVDAAQFAHGPQSSSIAHTKVPMQYKGRSWGKISVRRPCLRPPRLMCVPSFLAEQETTARSAAGHGSVATGA